MVEAARDLYEFGPFRLDTVRRRLLHRNQPVPLTPKAFDTLLVLIENCGQVMEKDHLMDAVWSGLAVEENNLTQSISALRKALGEKRKDPQYILTVPGVGYRFIGTLAERLGDGATNGARTDSETSQAGEIEPPTRTSALVNTVRIVERSSDLGSAKRDRRRALLYLALAAVIVGVGTYLLVHRLRRNVAAAAPNAAIRSIAVLPFKPLENGDGDEYVGLGMADALITKLSGIHQITVRPTSVIVRYQKTDLDASAVGRELEVDSVLDGRVQKSGDRIRLTVQLLRASDGQPLWGETFDQKYTDIFAVEDRISEAVVAALIPTLSELQRQQLNKHYTENTEAFQSYMRGRYYWNQRTAGDVRRAISFFEDAILQDPNYALAYAGLADSYATLSIFDNANQAENMPKARSAAMKALELDDGLGEAHASLAYVKHRWEFDFPGAEREFQRSFELNSQYPTAHQWYGWYLLSLGRFDQAIAEFQRAQQLDPRSIYTNLTLGAPYFYSRQYDRAVEQFKHTVELKSDFPLAHWWLFMTYLQQKRFDEALTELKLNAPNADLTTVPMMGYLYALAGQTAQARAMLAKYVRPGERTAAPASAIATIYAALGEKDQAFVWLKKAVDARESNVVFLNVDPRFGSLRSDARFPPLLKAIGLPAL
jgi:DNA-binding winged helix-turn-helix (wHTH) protein/TolB-like protein/Flp pilus assembly protein TadD